MSTVWMLAGRMLGLDRAWPPMRQKGECFSHIFSEVDSKIRFKIKSYSRMLHAKLTQNCICKQFNFEITTTRSPLNCGHFSLMHSFVPTSDVMYDSLLSFFLANHVYRSCIKKAYPLPHVNLSLQFKVWQFFECGVPENKHTLPIRECFNLFDPTPLKFQFSFVLPCNNFGFLDPPPSPGISNHLLWFCPNAKKLIGQVFF